MYINRHPLRTFVAPRWNMIFGLPCAFHYLKRSGLCSVFYPNKDGLFSLHYNDEQFTWQKILNYVLESLNLCELRQKDSKGYPESSIPEFLVKSVEATVETYPVKTSAKPAMLQFPDKRIKRKKNQHLSPLEWL